MSTKLPPPREIAGHYNRLMKDVGGDYVYQRWGDSEIKRRHYRQTEMGIRFGLGQVRHLGNVLEIGCGPAVWTTLYRADASSAMLVDISEEMLAQARARLENWAGGRYAGKTEYLCGDFLEMPHTSKSYDTIISSRAFEYMSDKRAFVRRCFGFLRPGGSLLVVTKNHDWRDLRETRQKLATVPAEQIPIGVAMHLDLTSPKTFEAMASEAGFADCATYPVVFGSYFAPFTWRPALTVLDLLHRRYYRRDYSQTPRMLKPLTESFLAIALKAG